MSTLLTGRGLTKSYEQHLLFAGVGIQLVAGDRLGIIGPNGAGKSTLLKLLAGMVEPDEGTITRRRGLRQIYVRQDDTFAPDATPLSAVADEAATDQAHHRMDARTRAEITLSKLGFTDFDQAVTTLSGGWKKRLSIARALVHEPDVLLLDEPTNHLDLEGTIWLERFIQQANLAVAIITHDRRFLENVTTRIIELSRAYPEGTFEVKGNYTEFVRRKSDFLDAQAAAESALAGIVRRDTAWLLQGVKARRTRNKTQLDDTIERKAELKAIKERNTAPKRTTAIDFQTTDRKTKKLLALHNISKSMGDKPLFDSLDMTLTPGQRVGLLGPNGSGKTTLLRILSGELPPDTGTRKPAADLRIVTFKQDRNLLDPMQTLHEALCPIGDAVHYRGKAMHVTGWAKKFLFDPGQLQTYVSNLSGGERARVLIANLMLAPADVLLLDEPTNDLDIPSLEVLEDALMQFPGAMVLITHDRFMLERISTEFLALDGEGGGKGYASLEHWQADVARREAAQAADRKQQADDGSPAETKPASASKPTKLTFKEQYELDGMEEAIMAAEEKTEALHTLVADPKVASDHVKMAEVCRQLDEAQQKLHDLYDRWGELEAKRQAIG